jgi:aryl-alcohol dehydrogenase-like predicted oxidoreductase
MEYRRLGRSGLRVSCLALGTMNFGDATTPSDADRIVRTAVERGINLLDSADVYAGGESQRVVGGILAEAGLRDRVLLTSKACMPVGEGPNDRGLTRRHVVDSCEASLRSLRTDRLDVFFLHRHDPGVPADEVLATLDLLLQQGKILHAACSTFPPWRTVESVMLAERHGWPRFTCEQPPYNLVDRRAEVEILPMCQAFDLGVLAWSPLAQGVLAGRYARGAGFPAGSRATRKPVFADRVSDAAIKTAERLAARLAARPVPLPSGRAATLAQFAIAFVLARSEVTAAIIGPRTPDQFEELLGAADLQLGADELAFCDSLVAPGRNVSNHFNTAPWMNEGG